MAGSVHGGSGPCFSSLTKLENRLPDGDLVVTADIRVGPDPCFGVRALALHNQLIDALDRGRGGVLLRERRARRHRQSGNERHCHSIDIHCASSRSV